MLRGLLRAGVEISVSALSLGHEQIETTQICLHADLELKERRFLVSGAIFATPDHRGEPDGWV